MGRVSDFGPDSCGKPDCWARPCSLLVVVVSTFLDIQPFFGSAGAFGRRSHYYTFELLGDFPKTT